METNTINESLIGERLREAADLLNQVMADKNLRKDLAEVASVICRCFASGHKLLICGNGGSAADAEHLAAEFSGKFQKDRPPLNAEALHVNAAQLTAIANDLSYDRVFSRLVQAKGQNGDVLLTISTSGNSQNVINALEEANKREMITVLLTGKSGGSAAEKAQKTLCIPSENTARIQEMHLLFGHLICEMVETRLF